MFHQCPSQLDILKWVKISKKWSKLFTNIKLTKKKNDNNNPKSDYGSDSIAYTKSALTCTQSLTGVKQQL